MLLDGNDIANKGLHMIQQVGVTFGQSQLVDRCFEGHFVTWLQITELFAWITEHQGESLRRSRQMVYDWPSSSLSTREYDQGAFLLEMVLRIGSHVP